MPKRMVLGIPFKSRPDGLRLFGIYNDALDLKLPDIMALDSGEWRMLALGHLGTFPT